MHEFQWVNITRPTKCAILKPNADQKLLMNGAAILRFNTHFTNKIRQNGITD